MILFKRMVSSLTQNELKYTSRVKDALTVMGSTDAEQLNGLKSKFAGQVIGTHCDAFHCDEVTACTMLLYTNKYVEPLIVRTRDQSVLDTLDIIVDVGGVYDVEKLRFDHHQKTFTDVWDA